MFEALRYDKTARNMMLIAGVLLLAVFGVGLFNVVSSSTAPATPTPVPPTATATPPPPPTATAGPPTPTAAGPLLDTPVPFDTAQPTDPPAATAVPVAGTVAPTPFLAPLVGPIVYAAMGASDTTGVGATNPDTDAWPVVVARHLPADTKFKRFGIGGIVLGDALTQELPGVLSAKPTLVTVWFAANDITHQVPLATYQQQLDTLLRRLTGETHAQVVLLNLPDLSLVLSPTLVPGGTPELRARVVTWNHTIAGTAAAYGDRVLLVDLFPQSDVITRNSAVLAGDNWHPSTAGYKLIGDYVYAQMQAAGLVGP
jgi:lysophospholipase L1-like esterase